MPLLFVSRNPSQLKTARFQSIMLLIAQVVRDVLDDPAAPGSLTLQHIFTSERHLCTEQDYGVALAIFLEIKRNSLHALRHAALAIELRREIKDRLVAEGHIPQEQSIMVAVNLTDYENAKG